MGWLNKEEVVEENLTSEGYIRKLEDQIYHETNVNHILHLILSLLTAGFWAIIWIILYISSNSKKKRLQRLIEIEYRMLSIKNKSDGE